MQSGCFPIVGLVEALRPAVVLSSVTALGRTGSDVRRYWGAEPDADGMVTLGSGTAFKLVAFNGSTRPGGGTWRGRPAGDWLPELVAELVADRVTG